MRLGGFVEKQDGLRLDFTGQRLIFGSRLGTEGNCRLPSKRLCLKRVHISSHVCDTHFSFRRKNRSMDPEYKNQKEASVSLLSGGGIWEINHVTLVAPVGAALF